MKITAQNTRKRGGGGGAARCGHLGKFLLGMCPIIAYYVANYRPHPSHSWAT